MLTIPRLFSLWWPLAAMWVFMSFEGPVVQSAASRALSPELNLAAYGYAFFSMLILESPIFLFLSASNALVKGPLSYTNFRNYCYTLCTSLTILCLIIGVSGAFDWISRNIVGMDEEIAHLAESCFICFAICPLMVGYRRFHQGILVKAHKSSWIAWGGALRILTVAFSAYVLLWNSSLPGGVIVSISLSLSIITEAFFIRWQSHSVINEFFRNPPKEDSALSLSTMNRFYLPLAVASMVEIGVQPLLTFFLAHSITPRLALASWPVLMSFVFIFFGPTMAYQDIIIAHRYDDMGNLEQSDKTLKRFGVCLFLGLSMIAVFILSSPLYTLWFEKIIGITPELSDYMYIATILSIPQTGLGVLMGWLRAVHTLEHSTRQIFIANFIELISTFALVTLFVFQTSFPGALSALLALTVARAFACSYLWWILHLKSTPCKDH